MNSTVVEFNEPITILNQLIIDISAVLNKYGKGTLYFGIKSDITTKEISEAITTQIKPQITPTFITTKESIIKVNFSGNQKPYSANGRYYIRDGNRSRELNPLELTHLITNEYYNWELLPSDSSIDDMDENQLQSTFSNTKDVLSKLNLISEDGIHLNNAGKLLFSNNPIKVKLAVYATEEKRTIINEQIIKGNIFSLIEECESFIKKHINWSAEIVGFERVETPEIPIEALREIIINSFAHANYISHNSHDIAIHPNKIAIYNPGPFPYEYVPEDVPQKRLIRNELICDVLHQASIIENKGTGLKKVYQLCDENNINVFYAKEYDGFYFYFQRKR